MKILMVIRMIEYANYVIQAVKHVTGLLQHNALVVQGIWFLPYKMSAKVILINLLIFLLKSIVS